MIGALPVKYDPEEINNNLRAASNGHMRVTFFSMPFTGNIVATTYYAGYQSCLMLKKDHVLDIHSFIRDCAYDMRNMLTRFRKNHPIEDITFEPLNAMISGVVL